MKINDYSIKAKEYAMADNSGTTHVAFKAIPSLIKKYSSGIKTLDYGCGSGCSTLFLYELGLEVEGVDICPHMLKEASNINNIYFKLIQSAQLPHENDSFDLVFSSFVLFEISSKNELTEIFNEIYRVLKPGGIFMSVTGTEELYRRHWLTVDADFPQNKNLKSGDIAKVLLSDVNVIVYDYYWTDHDYRDVIKKTQFTHMETSLPLGTENDGYSWLDEDKYPPYSIYVLKKN
ncbi:class I SAM-dependent methyltransferase [Fluoribacter gormanii]|uniref:class I SAM-dependent methyltransferase n=1 Tax=Fluoribacter gormanii TaxID=464 RepID=UPI001041AC08|nr:class I SAM-dependent methyltransferase [Fluoribacter gormanii]